MKEGIIFYCTPNTHYDITQQLQPFICLNKFCVFVGVHVVQQVALYVLIYTQSFHLISKSEN